MDNLPPNRLIVRSAASGPGKTVADDSAEINTSLASYNAEVGSTAGGGNVGSGGMSNAGGATTAKLASGGGGCGVAHRGSPLGALAIAAALGAVIGRRRRR